MHPAETDRGGAAGERRLAVPIAAGLALFLGGDLVLALPWTASTGAAGLHAWAYVASIAIRYGGALVVALCSFTLARRLRAGASRRDRAEVSRSAAPRRPSSPALVAVVVGLALMAASELQLPLLIYQVNAGNDPGSLWDGAAGAVVLALLQTGAYLGPVLTAVGTYLALRRLEDATTSWPPGTPSPSAEPVTDLDE